MNIYVMIAANFNCDRLAVPPFIHSSKLGRTAATWLALLAIVAQLLLPFAHAAAMDAGVKLAWCGTGKAPVLGADLAGSQDNGNAKIIVKCAICSVASLHAIAPPPAPFSLPVFKPAQYAPWVAAQDVISPVSYAIPPPPRGPPLIS